MKNIVVNGYNGRKLNAVLYDNVTKQKGIVAIVHGMQEHCGRYKAFCEHLEANGYVVFTMDLRGHGKNMQDGIPGYDSGDIFLSIVEDYKIILTDFRQKFPKLPIIVIGHSFGSFVTQRLVVEADNIVDKFVICGSTYCNNLEFKAGKVIAKLTQAFKGRKATAKLIEKTGFGGYAKSFKSEGGNWLTRDTDIWEKYQKDKLCGQPFPASFYVSLFTNAPKNYKNLAHVDESTPILLIAGKCDPLSKGGRLVKKLYRVYKKHWLNVSLNLYEGGRHELLNEINNEEIWKDVLDFINAKNKSAKNRKD